MKRLLLALVAAGAIGGGAYALAASGAQNPQYVYGGGHFNVNFCDGCFSPPRDFSVRAEGPNDAATGQILAGQDQSGGGGMASITVLCFAVSATPNASGGRTAVVGGVFGGSGPQAGSQVVFFVQDNTSPGGPAGVYDEASAFYLAPTLLVVKNKKTTCPDPDSTTIGPSPGLPVRYGDVTAGDIVVGG